MSTVMSAFKRTTDCWHPSFSLLDDAQETQLVEVSCVKRLGCFSVCVWGADDFGMEKEFTSKTRAIKVFQDIVSLPVVNVTYLKKMGFQEA